MRPARRVSSPVCRGFPFCSARFLLPAFHRPFPLIFQFSAAASAVRIRDLSAAISATFVCAGTFLFPHSARCALFRFRAPGLLRHVVLIVHRRELSVFFGSVAAGYSIYFYIYQFLYLSVPTSIYFHIHSHLHPSMPTFDITPLPHRTKQLPPPLKSSSIQIQQSPCEP